MTIQKQKNPRRVAAGKRNQKKRKGVTPQGRLRMREAALKNKPWLHSTGPTTEEGKAKVTQNLKRRQASQENIELQESLGEAAELMKQLRDLRLKLQN